MLQQNFNDMFYFIRSPSPIPPPSPFIRWCCVSFLIYFILFDSAVFALVFPFRCSLLLVHSIFFSLFSLSLSLFFSIPSSRTCSKTDATHIGTYVHVYARKYTLIRSPSWSINWWYCGNIEMSVFISFLFFLFLFSLAPHTLASRSFDIIVTLRYAFLYLMICSKSAYYPDPLSAKKNCTHVPNGTSCEHVCTENYFCQPFFVICHSSNPKMTTRTRSRTNCANIRA